MAITFSSTIGRRFTNNSGAYPNDNVFTAPAGSNRFLFIITTRRGDQNTDDPITSVTYGGVSATNLIPSTFILSNYKSITYSAWYIKEADIPSGSQEILANSTNDVNYAYIFAAFGVDQASTPTYNVNHNLLSGGPSTAVHSMGANAGKTAVAFVFAQGESGSGDFIFTPDSGSALFPHDDSNHAALAFINESFAVHSQANLFDPLPNNSTSISWGITCQDPGLTTVNRVNFTMGLFLDEVSNTSLTINQSTIEPGGTISGTYSGFTPGTAPTSPLVLSDGTNSINVAVTIDDTAGDGTGTFTGTVPSLPSAGNSGNFILFGNVTATLDDA